MLLISCEYTHVLNLSLRSSTSSVTAVLWVFKIWLLPKNFFQRTSGILLREKQSGTSTHKEVWQEDSFKLSTSIVDTVLIAKTDLTREWESPANMCFGLKRKSSNNSSQDYENEGSVFRNCLTIQIDLLVSVLHFWAFLMRNGSKFTAIKIRKIHKGL